jgi:hypothetical protein
MALVAVGLALCVLGVLFVALGFVGACRVVFRTGQEAGGPEPHGMGAIVPEKWAKLISALVELVKVAPVWFLCVFSGVARVGIGSVLITAA